MRHPTLIDLACLGLATCLVAARAAGPSAACADCAGAFPHDCRVPACRATWEEKKSSTPEYALECEHACARGRDAWHTPPAACRCGLPNGAVYVKKRLYKSDGEPRVERVPKYEVTMVPAAACARPACRGGTVGDSLEGLPWLKRLIAAP
jgi:hypothetical protein